MSLLTALMTAALLQSTPTSAPDLSWLAGYWLDCSGGREASETWSDPRLGTSRWPHRDRAQWPQRLRERPHRTDV